MAKPTLRKTDEPSSDIDLTPMLDVVFIMLIFFIVTATFIKEPGIDIDRPEAKTAEAVLNQKILIAIDGDGRIWMDKSEVEPHLLTLRIATMHADNPGGAVVIQADKRSTAKSVADVIDAAKQAGVNDISLAASK